MAFGNLARRATVVLLCLLLVTAVPVITHCQIADRQQGANDRCQRNRQQVPGTHQIASLRAYIQKGWRTLTRSNAGLAEAAVDPKFPTKGKLPVYVAQSEDMNSVEASLKSQMKPDEFNKIELRALPKDSSEIKEQGLVYLPFPYVVPGGRFNEMYGWDSYFIQIGLLDDGEIELAKDMTDNFIYEVEHYGKVLNANRTYYLSRSQPPFLTEMILNVFNKTKDMGWLRKSIPAVEQYYRYWTSEPHLTPQTGLSRYYDLGSGPAPEVVAAEKDQNGLTHYERAKEYYRTHQVTDYHLSEYYNRRTDKLTPLFYKGDRSMRESGFDPSERYGPFSTDIIHYNGVDLNCLLYRIEGEAAEIEKLANDESKAKVWEQRAQDRKEKINRYCWDEKAGLYFDYDFVTGQRRNYPFATTFYPLWVGVASQRQAARIVANMKLFEQPGGLQTSTNVSGDQWDSPFGWAPLELIAVQGLRRYGYNSEADRISIEFLSLIMQEFAAHNAIFEKYDVVHRKSQVSAGIKFGYSSNEIGFGWTNAAFEELYLELPGDKREKLRTW